MLRAFCLIGAGLLMLEAGAAAAADANNVPPQLQKAFAGTIVSTYPDGRKSEVWLNPDGTYTQEGRRHDRHHGRWTLKGDRVCFKRLIFTYCSAVPSGDAFTTKAVTGETIRVRLEPGRRGEKGGSGTRAG